MYKLLIGLATIASLSYTYIYFQWLKNESPEEISVVHETSLDDSNIKSQNLDSIQATDVGRLMLLAFNIEQVTPQYLLEHFHPAGFLFYPNDIQSTSQARNLLQNLREQANYSLLFGIDQEGGPFTSYRVDKATVFPGAMMLAATARPNLAVKVARATAKELAYVGFNLVFAPVVDVNSNPDNPIIGIRSFGDDPEKVVVFAKAFTKGLMKEGVAPVLKHFPGHGNTSADSHLELPRIDSSFEFIQKVDLVPYYALVDNVPAIMSSHIVFSELDENNPATFSPTILKGLLRDQMGFEGVVVTDFFDMAALTENYNIEDVAVKSVLAGADLLLVGDDFEEQRRIYEALKTAVEDGIISLQRVKEAINRTENLSNQYPSQLLEEEPNYKVNHLLAMKVAELGTTLIINDLSLPLAKELDLAIVAPQPNRFGESPHLGELFQEVGYSTQIIKTNNSPSPEEINIVLQQARLADVIILGVYQWLGNFPVGMQELYEHLSALEKPIIVVSLGNPDILRFLSPLPEAYLAVYGYRHSNLHGAVAVLSGRVKAKGQQPMTIRQSIQ